MILHISTRLIFLIIFKLPQSLQSLNAPNVFNSIDNDMILEPYLQ